MNALQVESILKPHDLSPLYLIVGEEDLLRDKALAALKIAVLGDGGDFNYDLFHGDETDAADIINCASEMPVFAARRLVVVKSAERLSAAKGDTLLPYLKNPVETTTLAFVSSKLDGRLRFTQALTKSAMTIDCTPLRDAQLHSWILGESRRIGVRLDEEAAQLLKEGGGSLYGIRRELEKLASYVPPERAVTSADAQALRGIEPGASVFDLTLAIAAADPGRALSILARNLDAGEAPLRILGSLAWQYRRLWKVKESLAQGGREGEAARTLRMDPVKVRPFVARFSVEHLQTALRLFLDADGKLKGGSGTRPRMVLESLLLRLCDYAKYAAPHSPTRPISPAVRVSPRGSSNVRTIKKGNRTGN